MIYGKRLSEVCNGRDNNFNLIRIVAAMAVLVTHSFALVTGSGEAEPLRSSLGVTMGSMAVDIFFVASGFLVSASLMNRESIVEFIWARVLRIYPAYIVMLALTIFLLGVYFTTLPTSVFLSDPGTYQYLTKCIILFRGVVYELPGVFADNPYKTAVNGSLWSMVYEVKMYAILAMVWGVVRISKIRTTLFAAAILSLAVGTFWMNLACQLKLASTKDELFLNLCAMFFVGAALYLLRNHVLLSTWIFVPAMVLLISAALFLPQFYHALYLIVAPYALFYLAYIPSGVIRKYNLVGDYSYGLYIYAFPVQQSIVASFPSISIPVMVLTSGIATTCLAALSWHLLEQRALRFKNACVTRTRKLLAFQQCFPPGST